MRQKIGLVLGVIMIGMLAARSCYSQPTVYFGDVEEAASCIMRLNHTCISDRSDGEIVCGPLGGFMVTKDQATRQQVAELFKGGPIGPDWANKAWVTASPGDVIPENAAIRAWGRVFAYGDPAFLDKIESGLQRYRTLFF